MVDLEARVKLVKDLKKFAVKELGIVPNRSFTRMNKANIYYLIYVSESEDIEWADTKLFSSRKECNEFNKEMKSQGYHTFWRLIEGFGDGSCPITLPLIKGKRARLETVVFHENYHIHSREKNFNIALPVEEAIADVFAYKAALEYHQKHDKFMPRHIKKYFQENVSFFFHLNKVLEKLESFYENDPSKAKNLLKRLNKMSGKNLRKNFGDIASQEINNAYFLMMQNYAPYYARAFEALKDFTPKDLTQHKIRLYAQLRKHFLME